MNETSNQQTVTISDIWELFLQRWVIIVLVAIVSVAVFFVGSKAIYRPMYKSTATLYIAGDNSYEGNSSADAYNSYTLALKVVSDCDYLLSSRSVVNQLIQEMDLKVGFATLQERISTKNPSNTRILEVTVEAETPDLAKQIVDRLCEIGEEKINEAMGANHVRLYEYGTRSGVPCNKTPFTTYLIIGTLAAVTTFIICLLVFFLDDRLRSAEQIEQVLGLSVLGDIPDFTSQNKKAYSYYAGRSPYGVYASGKKAPKKKGKV